MKHLTLEEINQIKAYALILGCPNYGVNRYVRGQHITYHRAWFDFSKKEDFGLLQEFVHKYFGKEVRVNTTPDWQGNPLTLFINWP